MGMRDPPPRNALNRSGYLSADLDTGRIQEGVRDIDLRVLYEFNF